MYQVIVFADSVATGNVLFYNLIMEIKEKLLKVRKLNFHLGFFIPALTFLVPVVRLTTSGSYNFENIASFMSFL